MIIIPAMMILLIFSLFCLSVGSRSNWEILHTRIKRCVRLLGIFHILLLLSLAYAAWPLLPAGQDQRSVAIETFLISLRANNVQTAMNMLVPAPEEEIAVIRASFAAPENRPVSWEVTEPNSRDYAFGEVTFADSQTLDFFIGLEWEWEKARWGVTMLEFGREQSTSKARFYLYSTFLPYSWFRSGSIYLSFFCALFTVWQVWRFKNKWADLEKKRHPLPNQAHNF